MTTGTQGNFPFSVMVFFSIYITAVVIARKALNQENRFRWLMPQAVFWAAVGGTSFKDLDLRNLDFTGAILENTDLRAKNFYRTCFRGVKGLENARVDNTYLDLDNQKVRSLLVNGYSNDADFSKLNLRGAYLKGADLRNFQLAEANLEGADLSNADLRDSVLLRTILTDADLRGANLTGACIKDWSFNQQTCFDNIVCDYVYREYEQGAPSDRYPASRNFEPGEFQTLFQKLTNAVELIFKDQVDWRALSFAFEKFQIEDDGLGLELKGVEQRGNYWVVKVTHGEGVSRQKVERQVQETYDDLRGLLEAKDQQINQLLGIMDGQTKALSQQSEALNNYSQRSFGNNFFISGSNITNLAGSGAIEYREAAECVRNLVTQPSESASTLQRLLALLSDRNIAATADVQQDLIQQVLLAEADNDLQFKQLLLQDGEQMIQSLSNEAANETLSAAVKYVMTQLRA
ncbi:MAG: pentapeptide repeat-containing protein [Phormidesmis sp.]